MNIQPYHFITVTIIGIISFIFSAFNFFIGKYVAGKILNNDLMHLANEVKEIKQEEKEYKKSLLGELNKIFRRLGKIEKFQAAHRAICDERHKKDK